MNTYQIDVEIFFKGTVDVRAENRQQAHRIAEEHFHAGRMQEFYASSHAIEDWDIPMKAEINIEDDEDDEDGFYGGEGDHDGNGFTFNLDIEHYLQSNGIDRMDGDMWEEILDQVGDRALNMMKEGYHQGELCISYDGEEFYGWWYSK